jgi:hypothetical protein
LTWKDGVATLLTASIVVVWLTVDSHRWAAAIVLGLGMFSCQLGTRVRGEMSRLLAALGVVTLVLGVLAIVTGSATVLALLVLADVLLWAMTTLRHATRHGPRPSVA